MSDLGCSYSTLGEQRKTAGGKCLAFGVTYGAGCSRFGSVSNYKVFSLHRASLKVKGQRNEAMLPSPSGKFTRHGSLSFQRVDTEETLSWAQLQTAYG